MCPQWRVSSVKCLISDMCPQWRVSLVTCVLNDVSPRWRVSLVTCLLSHMSPPWRVSSILGDVFPQWRVSSVTCLLSDVSPQWRVSSVTRLLGVVSLQWRVSSVSCHLSIAFGLLQHIVFHFHVFLVHLRFCILTISCPAHCMTFHDVCLFVSLTLVLLISPIRILSFLVMFSSDLSTLVLATAIFFSWCFVKVYVSAPYILHISVYILCVRF